MRTFLKIFTVIALILVFFACGKKEVVVSLEKEGVEYKVGDQVSFYYPKDFTLDTNSENKQIIRFIKDEEVITYTTIQDDTDNKLEDMPELYAGQLEEDGASEVGYKTEKIDSGFKIYEFTGIFEATGIKFEHVVYFTDQATYDFAYLAPQEVYDENIHVILQYLQSLTVHHYS